MEFLTSFKQIFNIESIVSQLILSAISWNFLIISHGYFFRYLLNKNTIFLIDNVASNYFSCSYCN